MKRLQYILLLLSVSLLCATCSRDDVDLYGQMALQEADVEYGESLTFSLPADLSSGITFGADLPEGAVTIIASSDYSPMEMLEAEHYVVDGCSTFTLTEPLTIGRHALHWVNFAATRGESTEFMLGVRLDVEESENITPDSYNTATRSSGAGTVDDPIEVASPVTLQLINDNITNDPDFTTKGLYYKQVCDLNFFPYSITYSGFEGVCPLSNRPFRGSYDGGGFNIKYLTVSRFTEDNIDLAGDDTTAAAGLFCHISGAVIENVNIEQPYIVGYNWVGSLVGAVLCETSLDMTYSIITNCHLIKSSNSSINSKIYGMNYVGGLVGGVDYTSGVMMKDCSNSLTDGCGTTISTRSYGTCLGGLIGGTFSAGEVFMYGCSNSLSLNSLCDNSMGGLIGGGYKITMANCENSGDISSERRAYGAGGLVGGACEFYGAVLRNSSSEISGKKYVGGIIGTTLVYSNSEAGNEGDVTYGNAVMTSAINTAYIEALQDKAGGIMGAGQLSVIDGYNGGDVKAIGVDSYVGGVIGYAPGGVFLNANNSGYIEGGSVAGIAGYTYCYSIVGCNNTGDIVSLTSKVNSYADFCNAGGILGFGGTIGSINMCNNYGKISGGYVSNNYYTDSDEYENCYVGGIVGRAGETIYDNYNKSNAAVSTAISVGLGSLDILSLFLEESSNKGTHRTGKAGGVLVYCADILRTIKKVGEGCYECCEIAEEGEEKAEWIESLEADMLYGCGVYRDEINQTVADKVTTISYTGKVSLKNGFDPMALALQNSQDFCKYADDEERSEELTEALREELVDISEDETKADLIKEGIKVALEAIVGVTSLVFGGIFFFAGEAISIGLKIVKVLSVMAADAVIDWTTTYTENENNCIVVSQCSNFGHVTGNGIIGRAGDQVRIKHSLSAGTVTGYTLAQDDPDFDGIRILGIDYTCIEYAVVAGSPSHDAHHKYSGLSTIIDSCHSSIDGSNDEGWSGYDEEGTYSDGFFDNDAWKLDSTFDFALIYKNRYMSDYEPQI